MNGSHGLQPLRLVVQAGSEVRLDAGGSRDPDGQALRFRWFNYAEVNRGPAGMPPLALDGGATAQVRFRIPALREAAQYHVIVEVRDTGEPALFAYRRVIINVIAAAPAAPAADPAR